MPPEEGAKARSLQLHASAVAVAGRAVIVTGAAGRGKSSLALQLMAHGAALIADDRTDILLVSGTPHAACPDTIRGRIEARGIGILTAEPAPPTPVGIMIDLDRTETERLPQDRHSDLLGHRIPLFHRVESAHFAAAILQYMKTMSSGPG